jgi:mono/diheme cytochrome c family protein
MKRVFKWLAIGVGSIIVIALVIVYGGSEYRLRQTFDIAAPTIAIPNDSASLALGRHIFETRGCTGCHGDGVTGKVFFDDPWVARLVAPNLTRAIRGYSDAELARLLRHGVRPNGHGVAVMPASMFYNLDDTDLGALIAYLRTLPQKEPPAPLPTTSMRILARVGLVTGQYKLEPLNIDHKAKRPRKEVALGEYLAKSSCTECHGAKLEGGDGTPALMIVADYSATEFAKLMRAGVPKDGRRMELMTLTAINRFSHFTDAEVSALHTYLSHPES